MFPVDELNELKDRISQMSDRELLRIVEVEYADYRREAIEFAEVELGKRSIPFEKPELDADEEDADSIAPGGEQSALWELRRGDALRIAVRGKGTHHSLFR